MKDFSGFEESDIVGAISAAEASKLEQAEAPKPDYDRMTSELLESIGEKEVKRLFSYEWCEMAKDFVGFLHVYEDLQREVPKDFTVIDLGCNQAFQGHYFKDHARYIGVECYADPEYQLRQENAEYYSCTIQEFIRDILPTLGLDMGKVFAVCSYVPDEEAQQMVAETFPYNRVVYCSEVISERKPPVLDFYNCLRLLEQCRDSGLIDRDPDRKDNILVYATDQPDNLPDGWYSQNIFDAAQELLHDGEGQRFWMNMLTEKRIPFEQSDWKRDYEKRINALYESEIVTVMIDGEEQRGIYLDDSHLILENGALFEINDDDYGELTKAFCTEKAKEQTAEDKRFYLERDDER